MAGPYTTNTSPPKKRRHAHIAVMANGRHEK